MLETVLMVVDFIVCVALIGAVLLQTGRGAGLSSSFGGGDGAFFVVEADGREIYHSKKLYTTDKERLKLDVKGAKSINLRVLMGKDKDCDHGDWAHAWLEAEK